MGEKKKNSDLHDDNSDVTYLGKKESQNTLIRPNKPELGSLMTTRLAQKQKLKKINTELSVLSGSTNSEIKDADDLSSYSTLPCNRDHSSSMTEEELLEEEYEDAIKD